MGRPRKHGDDVKDSLLDAAEDLLQEAGVEGLSIRAVADRVGTTTRAVYTVFGSKAGLLAALGQRAFGVLGTGVAALPETDDAAADLVEATLRAFRRFALDHPALFRLAIQQVAVTPGVVTEFAPAAASSYALYERRVARVGDLPPDAALVIQALCEGLAALELRCGLAPDIGERRWREAVSALVGGLQQRPHRRLLAPAEPASPDLEAPRVCAP